MEDLRCYDTYMDRVNTLLNEYAGEWLDTSMLGDANAHFAAGLTPTRAPFSSSKNLSSGRDPEQTNHIQTRSYTHEPHKHQRPSLRHVPRIRLCHAARYQPPVRPAP